jgi:hypothetical protein
MPKVKMHTTDAFAMELFLDMVEGFVDLEDAIRLCDLAGVGARSRLFRAVDDYTRP